MGSLYHLSVWLVSSWLGEYDGPVHQVFLSLNASRPHRSSCPFHAADYVKGTQDPGGTMIRTPAFGGRNHEYRELVT